MELGIGKILSSALSLLAKNKRSDYEG